MSAVPGPLGGVARRAHVGTRANVAASEAIAAGVFLLLAAYATLSYGELLVHPPAGRLLAAATIATAGCSALAVRRRDGRPLLPPAARPLLLLATSVLAVLAIGVPAELLAPARWGRLGHRVGGGVEALGAWLWPYRGEGRWARLDVMALAPLVIVMAGGLRFWPGAGRTRQTAALALLLALFLTGAANAPQDQPGLRGLVLLALIAAWLWAPSAAPASSARAARWLLLPALLALVLRPALSSRSAWIGFREATGDEASSATFQWDQSYGPIDWPRSETTMFTLAAVHPGLLRVTSLDRFDGLRFLRSSAPPDTAPVEAAMPPDRRFLTRSVVTIAGLRSQALVTGDGLAERLHWIGGARPAVAVEGDGTLVASSLAKGSVYSVLAYRPRPSAQRLRRAPRAFALAYMPYVRFELPGPQASGLTAPSFATEASRPASAAATVGPDAPGLEPAADVTTAARIEASPYGPMFRLARGFAAGAPSPYDVAERIQRYLLANYTYDEHPARARYPLEAFLFAQRRGYCQQFSGAMTLMLRMDGIPARVASGFRPELYDRVTGTWNIRALDAHSWVEVFFSGIGWVAFDPTPAAPIALPGASSSAANKSEITGAGTSSTAGRQLAVGPAAAAAPRSGAGLSPIEIVAAVLLTAVCALGILWLRWHRRLRIALRDGEGAVDEISRALARTGEAAPALTLDRLQQQMRERGEEAAADYLASLRDGRYSRETARASARGRAALRRALRRDGGARLALALLAAMPPGAVRRRGSGGGGAGGRA